MMMMMMMMKMMMMMMMMMMTMMWMCARHLYVNSPLIPSILSNRDLHISYESCQTIREDYAKQPRTENRQFSCAPPSGFAKSLPLATPHWWGWTWQPTAPGKHLAGL